MDRRPKIKTIAAALTALLAGAIVPPGLSADGCRFVLTSTSAGAPGARGLSAGFSLAAGPDEPAEGAEAARPVSAMPKRWRRALVQLGLVSAYSTYRYWKAYHTWIEDWQFELTFADQYKRFLTTEAIRFDSNAYETNWTHVIGGALYYEFARTNYLSWAESLLASFAASALYEYVSEWREVISVNDMFLTTFGGYSVGETWFQLSDFFHHSRSPVLRLLGFMNPVNELNQFLDRKNQASRAYVRPGWASFVLSAGWWRTSETGRGAFNAGVVSFDTQLIRIPEYGRPGEIRKVLRDTSLSELAIGVVLRERRPGDDHLRGGRDEEVDLYARVVGLSWFRQSIDALGRGSSLSIGLGSALTYLRKRPPTYDSRSAQVRLDPLPAAPTDFRDKMTVTHLFGPVLDWTLFGRRLKVRAVADAYADFALMNAIAFNAYSAVHPIEGMKATLSYYGYHYAYGASASGRVDVDWGGLWVRGLVSGHVWDSWEGLDRFEDELTNNVGALDTRTRVLLQAGWRFGSFPVRAFAGLEGIRRWGRVGDVRAASRETRTFAGLSYLF